MANKAKVREVVEFIDSTLANKKTVVFNMDAYRDVIDRDVLWALRPELVNDPELLAIDPDDYCGTSMCFAGWAVTYDHQDTLEEGDLNPAYGSRFSRDGGMRSLDLSMDEAEIFHDYYIRNTKDLREACNHWFAEEIFTPEEYAGSRWIPDSFNAAQLERDRVDY